MGRVDGEVSNSRSTQYDATTKRRWLRFTLIAIGLALIAIYAAGWWFMDVIPEQDRPRPKALPRN